MQEYIFKYRIFKLYFSYISVLTVLLFTLLSLSTIEKWTFIWVSITLLTAVFTVYFAFKKAKFLSGLEYFIKMDKEGIYTKEAFDFCKWNMIKSIKLKRYFGYKTLFFTISDNTLKTNISPIKSENGYEYCLPLADCKGRAKDIYEMVNHYYYLYK